MIQFILSEFKFMPEPNKPMMMNCVHQLILVQKGYKDHPFILYCMVKVNELYSFSNLTKKTYIAALS